MGMGIRLPAATQAPTTHNYLITSKEYVERCIARMRHYYRSTYTYKGLFELKKSFTTKKENHLLLLSNE
jgi:hypothetical protein